MDGVLHAPIARPEEVDGFLRRLPIVLDRTRFLELVLGFPRRYLEQTPAVEVVRHYALVQSLGPRPVVSSLIRRPDGWRLWLIARDRGFLFARIAGALSCFGLDIRGAEAFANAGGLVLDRFDCADEGGSLLDPESPRRLQAFLENVVSGEQDAEALLESRLPGLRLPSEIELRATWDDEIHPTATRLLVTAPDHFGLLYLVSRTLSEAGCNIEAAEVATPNGRALDAFYLTRSGEKIDAAERRAIEAALAALTTLGAVA